MGIVAVALYFLFDFVHPVHTVGFYHFQFLFPGSLLYLPYPHLECRPECQHFPLKL
jgi:hypothetical protein